MNRNLAGRLTPPAVATSAADGLPNRNASTRSAHQQYKSLMDRPEEPFVQPPGYDKQGDVDDDYHKANPWYGQSKSQGRPVYGLGKPFPHKVRFQKQETKKGQANGSLRSKRPREPDAEKGEAGRVSRPSEPSKGSKKKSRRVSLADGLSDKDRPRQTDTGVDVEELANPFNDGFDLATFTQDHDGNLGEKYGVTNESGPGQRESDEAEQGGEDPDELRNWWARLRAKYPEPVAEFLAVSAAVALPSAPRS